MKQLYGINAHKILQHPYSKPVTVQMLTDAMEPIESEKKEMSWEPTPYTDFSTPEDAQKCMAILESAEKKEEQDEYSNHTPNCRRDNSEGKQESNRHFFCSKKPIVSEKEERCTKCNGVGWTRESIASTAANTVCPHCNGSGKEPRKEDLCDCCGNDFHDCSCETTQWEINELEAKLSRYKDSIIHIKFLIESSGLSSPMLRNILNACNTSLAEKEMNGGSL